MKNRILKGLLLGSMIFAMSDGYSSGLGGFVPGSGKFNFGSSVGQTNPPIPPMTSMVKKEIKETISESQTQSAPLVQQKKNLNQSQPQPLAKQLLNSSKSKKNPGSMSNPSSFKKPETVTNTEVKVPSSTVVKKTEVVNDEQVAYRVSFLREQCCKSYETANLCREIAEKEFYKNNTKMLRKSIMSEKMTIEDLLNLTPGAFAKFINDADPKEIRFVGGNLINMNVDCVLKKMQEDYEDIKTQMESVDEKLGELSKVMNGPVTVESLNNLVENKVNEAVKEIREAEDHIMFQIRGMYKLDEIPDENMFGLVERVRNLKSGVNAETDDVDDFENGEVDVTRSDSDDSDDESNNPSFINGPRKLMSNPYGNSYISLPNYIPLQPSNNLNNIGSNNEDEESDFVPTIPQQSNNSNNIGSNNEDEESDFVPTIPQQSNNSNNIGSNNEDEDFSNSPKGNAE